MLYYNYVEFCFLVIGVGEVFDIVFYFYGYYILDIFIVCGKEYVVC